MRSKTVTRTTYSNGSVNTVAPDVKAKAVQDLKDVLKLTTINRLLTASYDEESKNIERKIFSAVYQMTKVGLIDREKREINAIWFSFVGLSAQNIRHLEICSITDFNALFSITNQELRSLADRGRLDVETKRKLLQSTVILQNHWNDLYSSTSTDDAPPGPSTPAIVTSNHQFNVPSLSVTGVKMIQSSSMGFATAPKSPKTASRSIHNIPHKWHRSTKLRWSGDGVCHFCQRPLGFGILNAWEKCRSCKWKVHTQCKGRVGDSCGLTPDHLRFLFDKLIQENNGGMWKDPQSVPASRSMNEPAFQFPDTAIDSSSSTNSSAPSTPALPLGINGNVSSLTAPYRSERKFLFPDTENYSVHNRLPILVISEGDHPSTTEIQQETENHNKLASLSGGNIESEGTIVGNQEDSVESHHDVEADQGGPSQEAVDKFNKRADGGFTWERHAWNMSTIRGPNAQASWNEVTIQLETIEFDKQAPIIGRGRFGKVLRGFHYGDVAVKVYNMDHISDHSKRAEEFKLEVSAYKNTRHDNIALFLGYFMNDGKYGMVMSLSRGSQSLYTLLHVVREKLDMATTRKIAQQICQAVSYLHTKKILHKDLRSKNILLESKNKVVITDFGILSMKRLAYPRGKLGYYTSRFWTNYLAPELAMAIKTEYDEYECEDFPFTESSDVYAFGCVWFEMLTGMLAFCHETPHQTLFAKSQGVRPVLPNVKCTPELKELLVACFHTAPHERPSLTDIHAKLTALPKKQRVNRSPSFPVMMKSYESTF
ncbi:CRE-KSR-1 protein [Caenorhabditis remanei]|uniref:CRE-KSR-1 protein n=1 Tax=Caenorhabditis remanei TaxID=31234 RepID=E3MJT6_CAERE|nr:CRE-KSR-1 protein [Caenorhabditis remanei]